MSVAAEHGRHGGTRASDGRTFDDHQSSSWLPRGWIRCLLILLLATSGRATAQEKPAAAPSGLGIRQQRVQRLVEEMDAKFKNLAQAIRATEPEKADRLVETLQEARTLHLSPRMKQVSDLLDSTKFDAATGEQKQLLADLERLLQLLLAEARQRDDDRQEREQLEAWRREVQKLLEQQRALHGENQKLGDKNATPPADRKAALDTLAKKQSQTSDSTKKLSEEMKKAAGNKPDAQPKPGSQNVSQASSAMEGACDCLGDGNCDSAGDKQEEAIRELEKALEKLDEKIKKLDDDTDPAPKIEELLRAMLERQRPTTTGAAEIETRRGSDGMLKRADRLSLAKLAAEERALGEAAQEIQTMIEEEGRAVVFPEIVSQLKTDLESIAARLEKQITDSTTRDLQRDVEGTLQELIDALQAQAKKKKESAGGQGGGGGGKPPLLPGSAELKLLKSRQLRVNRRTSTLASANEGRVLAPETKSEMVELSRQQASIEELVQRLIDRVRENMP